jgi:hypothetical protein
VLQKGATGIEEEEEEQACSIIHIYFLTTWNNLRNLSKRG